MYSTLRVQEMTYKPNLDLLRAVAVLLVLVSHLITVVNHHSSDNLHRFGQLGVVLFFVHTSLVLMQSLDRQHLQGSALFKRFYVQRLFRIYPLSIVFVLLIYVLSEKQFTLYELFTNLTLTQNLTYTRVMNGVLWSLPLEVQMYVVLPILYVVFRHRAVGWLLALWALTIPLGMLPPLTSMRLNVLQFVPCFMGGVVAWRLQGRERLPAWSWPVLLALYCAGFVLLANPRTDNYGRWVVCIFLGLTIPFIRQLETPLLNQLSKTIAKYSYGIYLFHFPLLEFAFDTNGHLPFAVQWLIFGSTMCAVAYAGYHLIEHPMIRLGAAWSEGRSVGKAVAPAS